MESWREELPTLPRTAEGHASPPPPPPGWAREAQGRGGYGQEQEGSPGGKLAELSESADPARFEAAARSLCKAGSQRVNAGKQWRERDVGRGRRRRTEEVAAVGRGQRGRRRAGSGARGWVSA